MKHSAKKDENKEGIEMNLIRGTKKAIEGDQPNPIAKQNIKS